MNEAVTELTLADGTKISTATGRAVKTKAAPLVKSEDSSSTATVARFEDFNVDVKKLNAATAVLVYTLIGIPRSHICDQLKITEGQLEAFIESNVFEDLKKRIIESILDKNSNDIRRRFHAYSGDAVNKVYDVLANGEDALALAAAKDLLDRAGHRPADVVQHNHSINGGLRIEFIKRGSEKELPTLEG